MYIQLRHLFKGTTPQKGPARTRVALLPPNNIWLHLFRELLSPFALQLCVKAANVRLQPAELLNQPGQRQGRVQAPVVEVPERLQTGREVLDQTLHLREALAGQVHLQREAEPKSSGRVRMKQDSERSRSTSRVTCCCSILQEARQAWTCSSTLSNLRAGKDQRPGSSVHTHELFLLSAWRTPLLSTCRETRTRGPDAALRRLLAQETPLTEDRSSSSSHMFQDGTLRMGLEPRTSSSPSSFKSHKLLTQVNPQKPSMDMKLHH